MQDTIQNSGGDGDVGEYLIPLREGLVGGECGGANPLLLNHLILTGKLHTYLANLNERAQNRYRCVVRQMIEAEGMTENLKRQSQREWIKAVNSTVNRVEEIIQCEMIYV